MILEGYEKNEVRERELKIFYMNFAPNKNNID